MFAGPFDHSIVKNAINKKLVTINFVNLRDFGIGRHKVVDDKPYGGGVGMILKVDVVEKAIESAKDLPDGKTGKKPRTHNQKVVLLDPRGKTYNQKKAREFSKIQHLILVCGHYEGIDERIDNFVDEKISIGDFILTGGEIPAMVITDSVIRLLTGTLKKKATEIESFSWYLEYPQYTKPRVYKNYSVPKVLLLGNHKKIEEWRKKASLAYTKKLRPDLLYTHVST
jgi:tRNA (guanine37-N1)-methyltransferase